MDELNIGSNELRKLATPENPELKSIVDAHENAAAESDTQNEQAFFLNAENAAKYSWIAKPFNDILQADEEYQKVFDEQLSGKRDFANDDECKAFVRTFGRRCGVDDPSGNGNWILQRTSTIDRNGQIMEGVTDTVRRTFTPREAAERVRNIMQYQNICATQGSVGLEGLIMACSGKPLGMSAAEMREMSENDPCELVRRIRNSGFYDGKKVMFEVLGNYDYDSGMAIPIIQTGALGATDVPVLMTDESYWNKTIEDDAKWRETEGKNRARQMVARYVKECGDAKNLMFALSSANMIAADPRLGEYWSAWASGRNVDASTIDDMQTGDVDAVAKLVSQDYGACTTDEERMEVIRRFNDITDMIAQDDSRTGTAHRAGLMNRLGAWSSNFCYNTVNYFRSLGVNTWERIYDRRPDGGSKKANDEQFAWFAKKAIQGAASQGTFNEHTWLEVIADEIVNFVLMSAAMKLFSISTIARTTGKAVEKTGKALEVARIGDLQLTAGVPRAISNAGTKIVKFGDFMDPAARAAYRANVAKGLAGAQKEIQGLRKFVATANEEITLGAEANIAKLEANIAKAEKYLSKSVGKDMMECGLTIANELPSVFVMETAAINEKQCAHAYEIGQRMGDTFKPELIEAAETYEIAAAVGDAALLIHVPKIFMRGVMGLTKSASFNRASKSLYTRVNEALRAGDTHGAMCLWDTIGLWQAKLAYNSLKGGTLMGSMAVVGDVSENYLRDKWRKMGAGIPAMVPTANGEPFFIDDTKPILPRSITNLFDASESIVGNYLTTATRASVAMHTMGSVAGAKNAIGAYKDMKRGFLDFKMLTNLERAQTLALSDRMTRENGGRNVVKIDGKEYVVDADHTIYDQLPDDPKEASKVIDRFKETNREAYEEVKGKIDGFIEEVADNAANLNRNIDPELREEMRRELGEKATSVIEDMFADVGKDNPFNLLGSLAKEKRTEKKAIKLREELNKRQRLGEYGTKEIEKLARDLFGVKSVVAKVDKDGKIHITLNREDKILKDGKSNIRDAELVIQEDSIEIKERDRYKEAWAKQLLEEVLTDRQYDIPELSDIRDELSKLRGEKSKTYANDSKKTGIDDVAHEGDPNGLIGRVIDRLKESGWNTETPGNEHLENGKSIITMNRNANGGKFTKYEIGHEMAHGILDQLRKSGHLTKEMDERLEEAYGGTSSWEELFVGDYLTQSERKSIEEISDSWKEIQDKYGETPFMTRAKDVLRKTFAEIGERFRKVESSIFRDKADKAKFEMFLSDTYTRIRNAAAERKRGDEARAKAAETIKAFDAELARKAESGERLADSEVKKDDKAGGKLQIEDKTKALEDLGYVKAKDGSWICEKTNPVEWHKTVLENAKRKLASGEELTDDERQHLGVLVDETGNTVGFVQSEDMRITGDEPYVFVDDAGNRFTRYDVSVVPFPVNAEKEFAKAAGESLGGKYSITGRVTRDATEEEVSRSRIAFDGWLKENLSIWKKKGFTDVDSCLKNIMPLWAKEAITQNANDAKHLRIRLRGSGFVDIRLGSGSRVFGGKKVIAKHLAIPNGTAFGGAFTPEELVEFDRVLSSASELDWINDIDHNDCHAIKLVTFSKDKLSKDGKIIWTLVYKPETKEINTVYTDRDEGESRNLVNKLTRQANLATRRNLNGSTDGSISYFGGEVQGGFDKLGDKNRHKMRSLENRYKQFEGDLNWLPKDPEDLGVKMVDVPISKPSNPDTRRFNITGLRGLERIVGHEEYKKIYKEIRVAFDKAYKSVKNDIDKSYHLRGGKPNPRMWEIEKKMQDGSVKLSLKVGGKTLRVHFTGAATDDKPRLEYAGKAANVTADALKAIRTSPETAKLGDIIDDDILKSAYPNIYNAPIVIASKGADYGGTGGRGMSAKITGKVGTEDNVRRISTMNLPLRQKVVTDRGASRDLTVTAIPPKFERDENGNIIGRSEPMIVIYEDSLDGRNLNRINRDVNQAIVDLIAGEEGWKDARDFSLRDWRRTGRSRKNSDANGGGYVDSLPYKVFALFGDPKLSLNNRDSLLNKVIDKYVSQYKGKRNANVDAVSADKIRDAIVETLSIAYQQFASIKEAKAWAKRMGMKAKELEAKDDALLDIDREGLVKTGSGLQSTRASEKVISFYDQKVAENIDKMFGKFFKANDATFRKLFADARKEFLLRRQAEAAARKINPTKVANEAAYQAYLAYCKENGINPRDKEDVIAHFSYESGKLGRKRVKDKQTGGRMVSLDAKVGEGDTELGDVVVGTTAGSTSNASVGSAIADVFTELGGKARNGEDGKDIWLEERDIAVREIAELLKSGSVGPNRAKTEMVKIVAKHSSTEKESTILMRVSEIAADVAKAMKVNYSITSRRSQKTVEDYLVEATAARLVRGRIYGYKTRTEGAVGKWLRKEASIVGVNEADIEAYAKRIESKANAIAVKCMDAYRNKANADEIRRIIGKMGTVNGLSRDIANAFVRGNENGVAGEYATKRAEKMADMMTRRQERDARGLCLAEINAKIGMDSVMEIQEIGARGGKFADGDDFATAFVKNFSDIMRTKKPEYASMGDDEFMKDSRARQDLAMTVKSWMRETAKRLAYGQMRRDAEVEAAKIAANSSAAPTFAYLQKTVQSFSERMADYIRRNGSNDTNNLIGEIERFIDKATGADRKVKEGEIVDRRKHDPNQQNYWRYVKKAIRMSSEEAAKRIDEIRREMTISHSEMASIVGDRDLASKANDVLLKRNEAMLEMNALANYGGLREKSYGEIRDTFDNAIAVDIGGRAAAFSDEINRRTAEYTKTITAFEKELGAFRDRKGRKTNELRKNPAGSRFVINSIADLFKRMEAYLHEGSEAYEAVENFRRDMSLAHIEQGNFNMAWEKAMRSAVKSIYGKDFEKVVEDLSIKEEKYDRFSRTAWTYDDSTGTASDLGAGSANLPTRLSKGNLIYIYMARMQADMQKNNALFGCDDTYMDALRNELNEKDIRLVNWLIESYAKMRDQISPVSERITGLKVLSPDENYSPLDFIQKHVSGDSRRYSANPFPSFLTRRSGHDTARLDEAQDPLRMFENRVRDAGHYIAFGEITERVSMTFKDARVQDAYASVIGTKPKNDLYAQLSEAIMGERNDANNMLNGVRNFITASSLFYNVGSAVKQLEGVGGWAVEMGVLPWLKGLVVNKATNAEVRQGLRELNDSGIFAVRGEEGISEAMVALANSEDGIRHGAISKTYGWYKRHGMDLTKAVDKFSSQFMAAQYYTERKKFYLNASGGGCTEEVAKKRALADTDYAIQVTQQSGRPEFLHWAQRGGVTGKLLTQFSGPAFVRWGVEVEALHRAFVMGDKGAKRRLFSKMAAMHLVCGPMLAMAGGLVNMILKDEDDEDDKLWNSTYRDCIVNMISGPLTGWFIAGQILNAGVYSAYGKAVDGDRNRGTRRKHFEAPILSKLATLQDKTINMASDVFKCVNWGSIDTMMLEDIGKDADDLFRTIVPAYRNVNVIRNAKEMLK